MLVEALMGLLFAAMAWVWGLVALLPALLVLTWSLVVGSAIDLEHRIIPNRLTLRLPLALLPLLTLAAWLDDAWAALLRAGIYGIAIPAFMFLLSESFRLVRGQQGIGMGDVKLAISIGMVVGYLGGWHVVVFAYSTVIAAMVIVIGLLVARRANLASRIPFGPYLAIGALVAVLAGDAGVSFLQNLLGF